MYLHRLSRAARAFGLAGWMLGLALLTGCSGSNNASQSAEVEAFRAMMAERSTILNPVNYATIYAESHVDVRPTVVGGMAAFYERVLANRPPMTLQERSDGVTTIALVVSPEGTPTNVVIHKSHYPAVDESVRSTVLNASYEPGRYDGEAVPVAMTMSVRTRTTRGALP